VGTLNPWYSILLFHIQNFANKIMHRRSTINLKQLHLRYFYLHLQQVRISQLKYSAISGGIPPSGIFYRKSCLRRGYNYYNTESSWMSSGSGSGGFLILTTRYRSFSQANRKFYSVYGLRLKAFTPQSITLTF